MIDVCYKSIFRWPGNGMKKPLYVKLHHNYSRESVKDNIIILSLQVYTRIFRRLLVLEHQGVDMAWRKFHRMPSLFSLAQQSFIDTFSLHLNYFYLILLDVPRAWSSIVASPKFLIDKKVCPNSEISLKSNRCYENYLPERVVGWKFNKGFENPKKYIAKMRRRVSFEKSRIFSKPSI